VVFASKVIFGRRRILNLILCILFVYAGLACLMFQFQRHFIYYPDKVRVIPASVGAAGMEVIAVQPANMKESIDGWYQPPADPSQPVIIYFHGNALSISSYYSRIQPFLKAGYGVLLAEYRGYGGNPGRPTERGLYADAEAYYQWLIQKGKIPGNRIVLYGLSLGTGVAVEQAVRHPDAMALILEAPFTSLPDLARPSYFYLPVDLLILDRYSSGRKIGKIDLPLLVMQGARDMVVPPALGKKLFNLANQPKTFKAYAEAGHNDVIDHGGMQDTIAFLESLKLKH
jgi:fermentation-respiration switch protein FrsA (DUF1100 family)